MIESLLRQLSMLRLIPRSPRWIDTPRIHELLIEEGRRVDLRTIQRDLNALMTAFPFALESDFGKPRKWWWRLDARQLEVPGLDAHAALTFRLVEAVMGPLLPPSTMAHLAPWFATARDTLNTQASSLSRWPNKVRVVPHSPFKIAANIDPVVQAMIYDALLQERQVEITYRAITTGEGPKTYPVHPYALVVRDQVVYLACSIKDYKAPRFLALHRVDSAQILDEAMRPLEGTTIDEMIDGEFGVRLGARPLNLRIRVRELVAKYLKETPIAKGQKIRKINDEWSEISARVPDTVQLRNWLRSLGSAAVVTAPTRLRSQLREEASQLCALYDKGNG